MRCASRPAGRAPWAALFVAVLALLVATDPVAPPRARLCCDALTASPARQRRSSPVAVADGAGNGVATDAPEAKRVVEDDDVPPPRRDPDAEAAFSDAFFQCYAGQRDTSAAPLSTLSCVGEGARVGLGAFWTRADHLHVSEGLTLVRANEGREEPLPFPEAATPFDGQHRSVIDSAAAFLSARALRWDMSGLYPGLVMRVGPTLSGSGWLEFILEPRRFHSDRQLGPSRTVLKQVILPFLLGLKVSVASLVPLMLFAIVFLAKKALLMSQLSALVSGLLGFGALGPHAAYGAYGHAFEPPGPLHNPLLPLRTSPQVFPNSQRQPPPGIDQGPHILHLGSNPLPGSLPAPGAVGALGTPLSDGLSPSWLSGTRHHLFRKVNYDFRDERHAATSPSSSTRNTKGFRWEDELRDGDHGVDPRDAPHGHSSDTSARVWATPSLG